MNAFDRAGFEAPERHVTSSAFLGFAETTRLAEQKIATIRTAELDLWWPVVDRLSIPDTVALDIAAAAARNRTGFATEAVALECVPDHEFVDAMAAECGISTWPNVQPEALSVTDMDARMLLRRAGPTALVRANDGPESVIAVATQDISMITRFVSGRQALASRFRIVTSRALQAALLARVRDNLAETATFELYKSFPAYSARSTLNAWQGCTVGVLAVLLPYGIFAWPVASLIALHVAATLFFFSCILLRFAAASSARPRQIAPRSRPDPGELPIYSVLVALHDEADVVADLIKALRGLRWPASKLDIKLVCEAHDRKTIDAIRRADPPPYVEIVEVPAIGPTTKPKALNFALQLCRGSLVVLFDAEDRPHPDQLVEAWKRFEASPDTLACLQAPLEITNGGSSWIARMFAFEYAALFRGLLPWLSSKGALFPLGGTSNHFRRAALEHVGAWDPYNVTEDADLGVRLARFGYSTAVISSPTLEDGPETFRIWLPQRTRWFKGWLQSWFVHARSPRGLYRDVGLPSFLIVQILFGGMVLSALVHPLLIVTAVLILIDWLMEKPISTFQSILLGVDLANIFGGYVSFLLLGWRSMNKGEHRHFPVIVALTPVYWMLMSMAAWRAAIQLCRQPHRWEKTPHGAGARRRSPVGRPRSWTFLGPALRSASG